LAKLGDSGPKRRLVWKGRLHHVYCAIRADGSSPARHLLDALRSGNLPGDTDDADAGLEPDERVSDYQWFVKTIKHFAEEGEPPYRGAINYLRSGIWEFKHGTKRLTFYDTSGDGNCKQHGEIYNHADADEPESDYWYIPNFDHELRLGHWFLKDSQTTAEKDLSDAEEVREEDLDHDRGK
jgi:hypothetical protein